MNEYENEINKIIEKLEKVPYDKYYVKIQLICGNYYTYYEWKNISICEKSLFLNNISFDLTNEQKNKINEIYENIKLYFQKKKELDLQEDKKKEIKIALENLRKF